MALRPDQSTPFLGLNVTLPVLLISLAVGFGAIGLWVMYDSKVVSESPEESAWMASQGSTAIMDLPLLGDDTVITLERLGCFGWCPQYEVSLFGSGRVEFRGRAFVCEPTPTARSIDRVTVAKLVRGFSVAGFETMPDFLREGVMDAETVSITLKRGRSLHTVKHYYGDFAAPRLLDLMVKRIDEVANTSAWIGKIEGLVLNEAVCVHADGTRRPLSDVGRVSDS